MPGPAKDPNAPLRMFKSPSDWFPVVLLAARVMQGKSQSQIVRTLKLNRTYVSKLEKFNIPILSKVDKIAAAYGLTLAQLCRMGEFLYSGQ